MTLSLRTALLGGLVGVAVALPAAADTCPAPWGDYSPCTVAAAAPLGGSGSAQLNLHFVNDTGDDWTWVIWGAEDPTVCAFGTSAPWVGFSPSVGYVPFGTSAGEGITVSMDATGFSRGIQHAYACVAAGPNPTQVIPIDMAVDDVVFEDAFETGDLSRWSASATGGGDLSVTSFFSVPPGSKGLQALVNDTTPLYVEDGTPSDEPRYRARFVVAPYNFDPGEAEGHLRTRIFIAFTEGPTRRVAAVVLRRSGGAYSIGARARRDDGTQVSTAFFPIDNQGHTIEIDLLPATAPGTANGSLELWVDGVSKARLAGLTNSLTPVDFVRMGALSVKTGASGKLFFDAFRSQRQLYMGP